MGRDDVHETIDVLPRIPLRQMAPSPAPEPSGPTAVDPICNPHAAPIAATQEPGERDAVVRRKVGRLRTAGSVATPSGRAVRLDQKKNKTRTWKSTIFDPYTFFKEPSCFVAL